MTVASCPSCRENVTLPVDATPECIVRCPLCREEFQLAAFLAQLPPTLIVLRNDPEAAEQRLDEEVSLWDDSSSQALASLETSEPPAAAEEAVPAFDFTPGSTLDGGAEVAGGAARRAPRRQKSSNLEVLKIVAGALLAIPAAQFILWWLVPSDWKRDLLGIGPTVSRVVPWVVPRKFRAPDELAGREPSFESATDTRSSVMERRRARQRRSSGSALSHPDSSNQDGTAKAAATPSASDTARPGAVDSDRSPTTSPDTPKPPAISSPTTEESAGVAAGEDSPPPSTRPELREAFESALQASIAWDTSPDQSEARRAELNGEFFTAFAELGETITYIVPSGDSWERDLVKAIQDVLRTFSQQPKKLAMIGNRSSQWLDQVDRPNQGVLLFGTVKQIRPAGEVFETEMELASLKQRAITVVSRLDPHPFYGPGDRLLMLGAIIRDPARNLPGYEGQEPMVVMGGLPTVLKP